MNIADAVSLRATCGRRKVGCVLVDKHHRILSTGYNSVAHGLPHCPDEEDCGGANEPSGTTHKCIARHAEDVAIAKCLDIHSIHTCYVTTQPCIKCVRRLLDTSCGRIIFKSPYNDEDAKHLWLKHGYEWRQL